MDKLQYRFQRINSLFYVSFLAIVVFYTVMLIATRMYFDFIPEGSVIWFMITALVMYLPLHRWGKGTRGMWMVAATVLSIFAGIMVMGYSIFIILLSLILALFIVKVGNKPIEIDRYSNLFVYGLLIYTSILSLLMIYEFPDDALYVTIRFYTLLLLCFIFSATVSQLVQLPNLAVGTQQWNLWRNYNAYLVGGALVVAILALVPAVVVQLILSFLRTILLWLFTPFTWIVKTVPVLKKAIQDMYNPSSVESDEGLLGIINNVAQELKRFLISDGSFIVKYPLMLLGIAVLVYLMIVIFRKAQHQQIAYIRNVSSMKLQSEEVMHNVELEKQPWWKRTKQFFRPYSGDEEHPVRKEYREFLSYMQSKNISKLETITVKQINQLYTELKKVSPIYEKVRYGNQSLTNEEVLQFRQDMHSIITQMKQGK